MDALTLQDQKQQQLDKVMATVVDVLMACESTGVNTTQLNVIICDSEYEGYIYGNTRVC
jgi:hypothetical protein